MSNTAELVVKAYYEMLGYKVDKARNQVIIGPGGRPFSQSYDFLGCADLIGVGPPGILLSQITMSESNLSRKRSGLDQLPWPSPLAIGEAAKWIRAEVVYCERIRHPMDTRRKAWRFTMQRFDLSTGTWPRRGSDKVDYLLWDDRDNAIIPQAML